MFRERNVRCADTKDKGRVDLKVRVFGGQVFFLNGDEEVILLFSVDELDLSLGDQGHKVLCTGSDDLDIFGGDCRDAVFHNDQGAAGPSAVGIDNDLVTVIFV